MCRKWKAVYAIPKIGFGHIRHPRKDRRYMAQKNKNVEVSLGGGRDITKALKKNSVFADEILSNIINAH